MARRWAPDGPALADRVLTITTAPLYRPRANYQVLDFSLATGRLSRSESRADEQGRLTVKAAGDGHQISFAGPGTGAQPPVLLPLTARDKPRVEPGRELTLPIRIYNPRAEPLTDVKAAVSSEYPTVRITAGGAVLPKIEPGTAMPVTVKAVFTAGAGYFAHARLRLDMTYDGWYQASKDIDVEITPEVMPSPLAVEILDGRTVTLPVFRQKGNQGGGSSLARTVTEGKGNGNGILEPGEEATIWVQMRQGMDPFDKNTWRRTRVYTDSPLVTEVDIFEESKQREWTAAQERTSIIRLSKEAPAGARVPLVLDNESWSFHFTPDVRYGRELLYQAFQLHTRHLHRYELTVR